MKILQGQNLSILLPGNRSLLLGISCMMVGGSCSESDSNRSNSWQQVLSRVDWGEAPAIFAPKYVDANQGNDVWSTLVFSGVSEPCSELFTPNQESANRREFWFLGVEFPQSLSELNNATTRVKITHVKNGAKELTVRATKAQIEQIVGFGDGFSSQGQYILKAWFPEKPHKVISCSSSKSKSGEEQTGSCSCEDGDGQEYECEQIDNFEDPCCDTDSDAGEILFTAKIRADYCEEACSEVAGLGRCGNLK